VLTVPLSLVAGEPAFEYDALFEPRVCSRYEGRAYDVVGFADAP